MNDVSEEAVREGHQKADEKVSRLVVGGVIFIGFLGLGIGVAFWMGHYASRPGPQVPAGKLPPTEALPSNPRIQLDRLHKEEEHLLQTYGWVDRERGTVRVPVERALDVVLQRGIPKALGEADEKNK